MERRLKQLRKSYGFTQQNVADAVGIDRTTYTYYETGASTPPLENLKKIARVFKVSVAYLIGESDVSFTDDEETDEPLMVAESVDFTKNLTKSEKALIAYYRSLEKEDRAKALEMIKDFVKDTGNK